MNEMSSESVNGLLPDSIRQVKATGSKGAKAMDPQRRRQLADAVSAVLELHPDKAQPILAECQFLSGTILANGIASAWLRLDQSSRTSIIHWVSSLPGDKRAT